MLLRGEQSSEKNCADRRGEEDTTQPLSRNERVGNKFEKAAENASCSCSWERVLSGCLCSCLCRGCSRSVPVPVRKCHRNEMALFLPFAVSPPASKVRDIHAEPAVGQHVLRRSKRENVAPPTDSFHRRLRRKRTGQEVVLEKGTERFVHERDVRKM